MSNLTASNMSPQAHAAQITTVTTSGMRIPCHAHVKVRSDLHCRCQSGMPHAACLESRMAQPAAPQGVGAHPAGLDMHRLLCLAGHPPPSGPHYSAPPPSERPPEPVAGQHAIMAMQCDAAGGRRVSDSGRMLRPNLYHLEQSYLPWVSVLDRNLSDIPQCKANQLSREKKVLQTL